MKPTENIEKLLENMNVTPAPDKDQQMLNAVLQAQADTKKQTPAELKPNRWRIIMHSKFTKQIAAAIVIIAGFLSLTLFNNTVSSAYAIEQTVEALRGVQNLRMSMSMGNQSIELLMLINQQTGLADHIRMDAPDSGDVTITIPGQTYLYKKNKNEVTLLSQELLTNDLDFKDPVNSLVEQTGALGGRIEIVKGFDDTAQQKVITVRIIKQDESIAGEFLIDPDSNLPLYIGIGSSGDKLNYMGPIEYNVEMPTNAFEFVIPRGSTVIDNRPEELKNRQPEADTTFNFDLSETAKAMRKAHNVHGVFIDRNGRQVNMWGKIDSTTGMITVMRVEYEDGGLYIITKDQTYFEDDGLVAVKEGQYMKCGLLFNDFISEAAQQMQDHGMMEIEQQYSEEFQREVICVDIKQPQVHLKAIVDIKTKRPIKFSIPWAGYPNEPLDYTELIEYNVDLPSDFFDFEIGPSVMMLGKELDTQFAEDPAYGMTYDTSESVQDVCERIAGPYLQAKIDRDIKTIKQLHSGHINRCGSNKMIEKTVITEEYNNGRIVEVIEFKPAYERWPHQMMLPCKVVKEHNGQRQEMFSGVIVYLREHDGQKSAVVTGYFPRLSDKQVNNTQ